MRACSAEVRETAQKSCSTFSCFGFFMNLITVICFRIVYNNMKKGNQTSADGNFRVMRVRHRECEGKYFNIQIQLVLVSENR